MTSTPPGWYDDGHGAQRWWDGVRWTENVQPTAAPADPVVTLRDAAAPAYPAAPPPRQKSNLWIVWVVIGVLVLGLVITAIVLIPMLLGGFFAGSGDEPSDPDERAALAAVDLWDEAWDEVDCDKFFEATTEDFRAEISLADCAAFEEQAQFFTDSTDDYDVEVDSIQLEGDTIVVTTTETYETTVGEDGETLDSAEHVEETWQYYVIQVGDGWVIDDAGTTQQ